MALLIKKEGYISPPIRTLLMQISEMGMLYRKVTQFVESRTAGTSKGGMTEQV
jgi:gamma-tubulin complex component 3